MLLSLISQLGLSGCATTPAAVTPTHPIASVQVSYGYNGRPVIPISVNGDGPYEFILDTASTKTVIFENLRRKTELPSTPSCCMNVFSLTAVNRQPVIQIDSLAIANHEIAFLPVVVFEDWATQEKTPQGVLGLDVLSEFLIHYDEDSQTLHFYDSGALPAEISTDQWFYAPLKQNSFDFDGLFLFHFNAEVGMGHAFPLLLDTGAEISLGNFPLLDMIPTIKRQAPAITDMADQQIETVELRFYNMRAGGVRWDYGSIYITDAQIFPTLGYGDRPLALIGFDLLGARSFAIDFKNLGFYVKVEP
ncbi:retropepsin-like aspartic protease [Hyphococcus flavus]|uniref:Retropepsin-like aspartic protease n=2 Tax=Hyphococcus flavus TaxID=1866326 RepID=A0AAE9ZI08_9PROT|nr:retropepsin-like aspartic protease [Hyphococcus flavus]WDI33242.1 retropepsin-like aspartic protease [Hyphococcus flavus]